jgi:antisense regulator of RalR protein
MTTRKSKNKPRFKITAQVIKPGGLPTTWTRFTDCRMTQKQCEKLLSSRREAGKSIPVSVTLENFSCEVVSASSELARNK